MEVASVYQGSSGTRVEAEGWSIRTPYSEDFLAELRRLRPAQRDLLDEILRSEHPPYILDRLAALLAHEPARGHWTALDFGCGAGASSVVLARLGIGRLIGVDLVNDYAQVWRQRLHEAGFGGVGTFVQAGDTLALPFESGAFDAVFLNGVIEHLLPEERSLLLAEALRLTREGGRVFISETPNKRFPRNSHTKLWFSELLPASLAASAAARFGPRPDFPKTGRTAQYRTGFRGASVAEIGRMLGDGAVLLPPDPRVAELEFLMPRNPLDSTERKRQFGAVLWRLARMTAALLGGQPVANFAPHLNLVYEKRSAKTPA